MPPPPVAPSGAAAQKPAGPKFLFPDGPSLLDAKFATEQLGRLDEIFGTGYFERGELVITAVRDLQGVAKVAHKLQSRLLSAFGDAAEVKPEFIKDEEYRKPRFATPGENSLESESRELELPNICNIPEGLRVHPYLRQQMPTLEILLIWRDQQTGASKSHTVLSILYPHLPTEDDIPRIFDEVEPYFKKRWVHIMLQRGEPMMEGPNEETEAAVEAGELAPAATTTTTSGEGLTPAGAGLKVEVLACHPTGFAKDGGAPPWANVTPVEQCEPLVFGGTSDGQGMVKICMMPALLNKVRVPESEEFYSGYVELPMSAMTPMGQGVTKVPLALAPKALASLRVKVFLRPTMIPVEADMGDAYEECVDWGMCEREPLPEALVSMQPFNDHGGSPDEPKSLQQDPFEPGSYVLPSLTEGMVELSVSCPGGYAPQTKPVMILIGENMFYVPLTAS